MKFNWNDSRGADDGRDRKTAPTADSGAVNTPGPSDDGAVLTAKDIQAARDALNANAVIGSLYPGGVTWPNTGSTITISSGSLSFFDPEPDPEITVESTGIELG